MKTNGVNNLKYSAELKQRILFQSSKYNTLLNKGLKDEEIKITREEENILLAPSADYGKE